MPPEFDPRFKRLIDHLSRKGGARRTARMNKKYLLARLNLIFLTLERFGRAWYRVGTGPMFMLETVDGKVSLSEMEPVGGSWRKKTDAP